MYHFKSKRTGKCARSVSVALLAASLVLYISQAVLPVPYRPLWQTGAIISLVCAFGLIMRFSFKSFSVDIVDKEGSLDMTVTEIQGKSRVTVCRIALSGIEKVEILHKGDKIPRELLRDRKKFSYLPDLFMDEQCLIWATECGEKLLIILEPDEQLIRIISPT